MDTKAHATAAVLCPGESLTLFEGRRSDYGTVVAVNRAAERFPADWWAFMDWQRFLVDTPTGKPKVVTTRIAARTIEREGRGEDMRRHGVELYEDHRDRYPLESGPTYTVIMAVYWAWRQGANRIDLFGVDMRGDTDWDGKKLEDYRRDDRRWGHEGTLLASLIGELGRRGCVVRRVTDDGPAE